MIIQKSITTSLDITSKEMTGIMKDVYMSKLTDKFVNKCYAKCYITKITDVVTSYLTMRKDKPGHGIVNIRFTCDAIMYQQNEIVIGGKVIFKDKLGNLVCQSDKFIAIASDPIEIKSLEVGQYIPLRVLSTTYSIGQDDVTITASTNIISYEDEDRGYKLALSKKVSILPECSILISLIKMELSYVKDLSSSKNKESKEQYKIYLKFKELLYPYKKRNKKYASKIKSIEDVKDEYIIVTDTVDKNGFHVAVTTEQKHPDIDLALPDLNTDGISVIKMILEKKLMHMVLLRNLSTSYDNKTYTSHKNIWSFYEKRFKK